MDCNFACSFHNVHSRHELLLRWETLPLSWANCWFYCGHAMNAWVSIINTRANFTPKASDHGCLNDQNTPLFGWGFSWIKSLVWTNHYIISKSKWRLQPIFIGVHMNIIFIIKVKIIILLLWSIIAPPIMLTIELITFENFLTLSPISLNVLLVSISIYKPKHTPPKHRCFMYTSNKN